MKVFWLDMLTCTHCTTVCLTNHSTGFTPERLAAVTLFNH